MEREKSTCFPFPSLFVLQAFRRSHARSLVERPLVLPAHFLLFLRGEVVLDVERLPDLLGALSSDHVRDRVTREVQELLDVQVVGRQDELEERTLVYLDKIVLPVLDLVVALGVGLLALLWPLGGDLGHFIVVHGALGFARGTSRASSRLGNAGRQN